MLEGIIKYKQIEGTSLSTFLYTFITNEIIDASRNKEVRCCTKSVVFFYDVSFVTIVEKIQ
jgi:DNA-directed RNA polymerase specialized sigma24 family protein